MLEGQVAILVPEVFRSPHICVIVFESVFQELFIETLKSICILFRHLFLGCIFGVRRSNENFNNVVPTEVVRRIQLRWLIRRLLRNRCTELKIDIRQRRDHPINKSRHLRLKERTPGSRPNAEKIANRVESRIIPVHLSDSFVDLVQE